LLVTLNGRMAGPDADAGVVVAPMPLAIPMTQAAAAAHHLFLVRTGSPRIHEGASREHPRAIRTIDPLTTLGESALGA
jgi:hypothetical protein